MNEFKPFSQREILAASRLYESSTEGLQIVTEANLAYAKSLGYIFLSHSNKDKALALAFVRYMEWHGVKTYIDLYDSTLPLPPSAITAQKLKNELPMLKVSFFWLQKIRSMDRLGVHGRLGMLMEFQGRLVLRLQEMLHMCMAQSTWGCIRH